MTESHNAPVKICNHCPTPPPPPPSGERVGYSRAKVWDNYSSSAPKVQGKWQGFDIRILSYPMEIFYCEGGAKSKVLTSSSPPRVRAYSRALKAEKS